MISEMGCDVPDRMPNAKLTPEEKTIQASMGFGALEENMHNKSAVSALPEHPKKES
jgi:hypothetical protein